MHGRDTFAQSPTDSNATTTTVTNQIESKFLLHHMQTTTLSTRRESDPYQPQQNPTSDHLGNMQNRTFFLH